MNKAINASVKGICEFEQIKKLGNPYDVYNRYIWLISLNLRANAFDNFLKCNKDKIMKKLLFLFIFILTSNLHSETILLCDLGKSKTKVDYLLSQKFKFSEKKVKNNRYSLSDYKFDYYILKLPEDNINSSVKRISEERVGKYSNNTLEKYEIRTNSYHRSIDERPNKNNVPYNTSSLSMADMHYLAYSQYKSLDRESLEFRDVSRTQIFYDYSYASGMEDTVYWNGLDEKYKCQIADESKLSAFRKVIKSVKATLASVESKHKEKRDAKKAKDLAKKASKNKL